MVAQSPRRGGDDMRPAFQCAAFVAHVHASHARGQDRPRFCIKPPEFAFDLQGQLARRGNDNGKRCGTRRESLTVPQKRGRDGKTEAQRLARAGLRRNQQVTTFQSGVKHRGLNRCQRGVSTVIEGRAKCRMHGGTLLSGTARGDPGRRTGRFRAQKDAQPTASRAIAKACIGSRQGKCTRWRLIGRGMHRPWPEIERYEGSDLALPFSFYRRIRTRQGELVPRPSAPAAHRESVGQGIKAGVQRLSGDGRLWAEASRCPARSTAPCAAAPSDRCTAHTYQSTRLAL